MVFSRLLLSKTRSSKVRFFHSVPSSPPPPECWFPRVGLLFLQLISGVQKIMPRNVFQSLLSAPSQIISLFPKLAPSGQWILFSFWTNSFRFPEQPRPLSVFLREWCWQEMVSQPWVIFPEFPRYFLCNGWCLEISFLDFATVRFACLPQGCSGD